MQKEQSWKARKMIPEEDTLETMAMHYGISSQAIVEVILGAEVPIIRKDGFRGPVSRVKRYASVSGTTLRRPVKVLGWSDGQAGIDPGTTRLTERAIYAVARWKYHRDTEKLDGDTRR